ncbi:MAG: class I SAM-dependent methyltransferase [Chitinophagaceae bacterium]|nr:class I SAM-dependent methyltransferase [Chitinophagaceae bacterium]
MNEFDQIKQQQKESWNKFSAGWKKWDELTMSFLRPMGQKIIEFIKPEGSQTILDIASGTGEPALSIATMLTSGKITMVDISDEMLSIAKENAAARNIANTETIVSDVSNLPFDDNTFDSISCRFGFMFFPDMQIASNEMNRVLKPSGKIAVSVWNIPEKNFWVTATMGTIMKHIDVPPNPSGAPGMFRCCKPGLMKEIFDKAGFKNIEEEIIATTLDCGTPDRYWSMMTEVGAPIVAALGKADDNVKEKIKNEVFEIVAQRYPGNNLQLDASAIVITAEN